MARLLLLALICAVSIPAMASRARLLSLGQDQNGSLYIEDTRSIFLNPALLKRQGDFANFEMGSTTPTAAVTAEGGMFRDFGAVRGGVQLGRKSNAGTRINYIQTAVPDGLGINMGLINPQNTVEVMAAGGDSADSWGASILFGSAEDLAEIVTPGVAAFPNKKANTFEIRGGLAKDTWNAFAHLDMISRSENETAAGTTAKFEMKPSLRFGGAMDLAGDSKVYANLNLSSFSVRQGGAASDNEGTSFGLATGWVQYLTPETGTRLFYTGGLAINNSTVKNPGAAETKLDILALPVALGLETAANDWLTIRASIAQNVIIDNRKSTVTDINNPNSTRMGAGAGFKWKKLTLDATLAGATTGDIDASSLLAQAGLTYIF